MPVVRMNLDRAGVLAAGLEQDGRALFAIGSDLGPDLSAARALLQRPAASGSEPLGRLDAAAERLHAMAADLEWRLRSLADADEALTDTAGRVMGTLAPRELGLVSAGVDELASIIASGSPVRRRAALAEALIRGQEDPAAAAAVILAIGTGTLVTVWEQLLARNGPPPRRTWSNPLHLARLQTLAATSGNQRAISVVSETAIGLQFADENRALGAIVEHFDQLDTAAQGGRPDGLVSVDDLEAATEWSSAAGAAAAWLLRHPQVLRFLTLGSERYLDTDHRVARDRVGQDRFTVDEIERFRRRRDTTATVWPLLPLIDVAAQRDPARADGFTSRADFEAALDWPGLSDHQRAAIRHVIDDGVFATRSEWSTVLTAAGWTPVLGDAVDLAQALHAMTDRAWDDVAFHAAGLLPVPGVSGSSLRVAREMSARAASEGFDAAVEVGARAFLENAVTWTFRDRARALADLDGAEVELPAIIDRRPRS